MYFYTRLTVIKKFLILPEKPNIRVKCDQEPKKKKKRIMTYPKINLNILSLSNVLKRGKWGCKSDASQTSDVRIGKSMDAETE